MNPKIGVCFITQNRPDFLRKSLHTFHKALNNHDDIHIVVVQDGGLHPYAGKILGEVDGLYSRQDLPNDSAILYSRDNIGVGCAKNMGLRYLQSLDCDYFFVIEDDITCKDSEVFNQYIKAFQETGIHHFMYGYHGPANKTDGSGGSPNPRLVIEYNNDVRVALNLHCVGAFCFYTRQCLEKVGLMDPAYFNAAEHIDHSFNIYQHDLGTPFWWWADLANSPDLLDEQACSEKNSSIRPRSDWSQNVKNGWERYKQKWGQYPTENFNMSQENVLQHLKHLRAQRNK